MHNPKSEILGCDINLSPMLNLKSLWKHDRPITIPLKQNILLAEHRKITKVYLTKVKGKLCRFLFLFLCICIPPMSILSSLWYSDQTGQILIKVN